MTTMSLSDKLLAAALTGAVLGAAGCASTASQSQPTTPESAAGDKHQCKGGNSCQGENHCKGEHSCKGSGAAAGGEAAAPGAAEGTGEKASCKQSGSCHAKE
jgi:hypothetical protein